MAEQELDRNEAATPYKLQKAREKGQVAKSPEVVSAMVFIAAMVFLAWRGWGAWREVFRFDRALLIQAGRADGAGALWSLLSRTLSTAVLALHPVLPDPDAGGGGRQPAPDRPAHHLRAAQGGLDPPQPGDRVQADLSLRTLFVAVRSLLKLVVLSWVVFLALRNLVPHFYLISTLPPLGVVRTLLDDIGALGLQLGLALAVIAVLDLAYTRREFAKQMRMSRRELKDEHKHREGDPRIRARLRELRREMLKRILALKKARQADVVITNPTHYAVALRYVHGEMPSPQLVAKGSGHLAAVIRSIAAKHRIPVVQNPTLARRLYRDLPVDQHVPPELFAQVARIIVWVFAMRERAQQQAAPATGGAPWSR
ncbi:MAG: EscU/YscU/HrcU family type III secretion system export apparatus switch protein [Anaeromyxobacter sp.]